MSPLSSSSSPNFFAQQNGGAAGSSAQNRGQFRRQGSSYGAGHVHNMAVAVAPTRIDYSLNTKGGLRSWVVLIVFVLLCSAVLTIFSDDADSKEEEVQPLVDLSESDNDLEAEEALAESESAPTIEDEEEIVEPTPNTEEVLLAKLKEKALKNEVRRKTEKQKRTSKPMKVEVVEEEEDEEDDDEEEDEKVDSDEEDQTEEEEEEENTVQKPDPKQQPQRKQNNAQEVKLKTTPAPTLEADEDDEDDDVEDDEDGDEAEYIPHIHLRRKDTPNKKRFKPWEDSIQAKKLSEDHRTPRKSLLKQKKQQHHPHTPITHQPVILQQEQQEETLENTISEKFVEEAHALSSIKKKSGYTRKSLTNREDFKFRDDFDSADFLLEKHEFSKAMKIYDRILSRYKESPRAHFGRGRVFQLKSEFASLPSTQKEYLGQANMEYSTVIENEDTPDQLFRLAAESLIVCSKFIGNLYRVHKIQRSLIDRFPEDLDLQNDFGITFLMMGRPNDAKNVFENVLNIDPTNNIAQAYYGYILKLYENELEKGVHWMRKGLKAEESILDSKFYFHLGDALTRLGRNQEAYKVYEEAVHLGLFPSIYQRSVHNLEGLLARSWWALDQTGCGKHLKHVERQWIVIREEAVDAWNQFESNFETESNRLSSDAQKVLYLRKERQFQKSACRMLPNTCDILQNLLNDSSCIKDQIKISVMTAGSRLWPHCGTTNYELEAQLGLQTSSEARIRVSQETKGWKAGKFIVFDNSFETEMWFDGAGSNSMRMVLSLNLWHPHVPKKFRENSDEI